jgi:ketopantoate reductase
MGSSDAVVEKLLRAIVTAHGPHAKRMRGVVLQDFLKQRPTEAHYLNGLVVRKGKEAGVPTPANEAIMHVVERIERGELKPQRSNLDIVAKLLG